ncbi:MAG TPA: DUF456 family protein [Thermoanaerobaculia bacterium]|nr:DUF456 family protein [Thermoanaerobaculia bacterium]
MWIVAFQTGALAEGSEAAPLLWLVAAGLVLAGIAGTFLPILPGAPLVFLGLLVAAWADDFQRVGAWTLGILALLTLLTFAIDLWAARHGARRVGASRLAMAGALLGTVVGIFFSLPGLLLGPFIGAAVGEYLARRSWKQAGRAGLGTWLGILLGTAARLALVFLMIGLFVTVYLLHD